MNHIKSLSSFSWEETPTALKKTFTFQNFSQASTFITQLIPICESLNHHPSILWTYNKITLTLSTHDQGHIVTSKDRELAQAIDHLFWGSPKIDSTARCLYFLQLSSLNSRLPLRKSQFLLISFTIFFQISFFYSIRIFYIYPNQSQTLMTSKQKTIQEAQTILSNLGLNQNDYIISLQGPTIIPTQEGKKKLEENPSIENSLNNLGVLVLM